MSRDTFVVAGLLAGLIVGWPRPEPSLAQSPEPDPSPTVRLSSHTKAPVRGDAVSGCTAGAPVVRTVITLSRGGARGCQANVSPALVCVAPGGVIRWKVENDCASLPGSKASPALKLTRPDLRHFTGSGRSESSERAKGAAEPPSILTACETQFDELALGASYLYCTIHDDAPFGIYKYGMEGARVDPLDPDVEVQPGG